MDVKEAVWTAKVYVSDLFKDQIYSDPLLEEVEFDDNSRTWQITVGFLRLPEIPRGLGDVETESRALGLPDAGAASRGLGLGVPPFAMPRRTYKVVRINDEARKVVSVKDRD
jgi:hypothetical protein